MEEVTFPQNPVQGVGEEAIVVSARPATWSPAGDVHGPLARPRTGAEAAGTQLQTERELLCPSPKTALGQHDPAMPILCVAEWGRPATSTAPHATAPPPDADALPWWVTGGWGPQHGGSDHHVTLQHEVIQGHTPSPPRSHIWALSHPYTVPGLPAGTPTGRGEEKLQPSLDVEVLHGVRHPTPLLLWLPRAP